MCREIWPADGCNCRSNPNGRPNSDVLRPWMNGMDVTRRPADHWIIDFGWEMNEREAASTKRRSPIASPTSNRSATRIGATLIGDSGGGTSSRDRACGGRSATRQRYIATPTSPRHRLFCWCHAAVCPDHQLMSIARDDDTAFGILHSRFHEAWALRLGTAWKTDPRYTIGTTFETFPFPEGLTSEDPGRRVC